MKLNRWKKDHQKRDPKTARVPELRIIYIYIYIYFFVFSILSHWTGGVIYTSPQKLLFMRYLTDEVNPHTISEPSSSTQQTIVMHQPRIGVVNLSGQNTGTILCNFFEFYLNNQTWTGLILLVFQRMNIMRTKISNNDDNQKDNSNNNKMVKALIQTISQWIHLFIHFTHSFTDWLVYTIFVNA